MSVFNNRIRQSEFLRNVFTLVSASSIAQAVAILIYPLLTRLYTPSEHGLFALYMSIISVTSIVSTAKYELAIMLPPSDKEANSLVILSLLIVCVFSLILSIPAIFFNDKIAVLLGNPELSTWLLLVPLSTFLLGFISVFTYRANRQKKFRQIAGANLGQSLVNSGIKISSASLAAPGAGLILGAVGGQLAGLMVFLRSGFSKNWLFFKTLRSYSLLSIAKKYRFFPRFSMIHHLVNNLSMALPYFVFSSYFSAAETGFFSVSFAMISRPMNLFSGSFFQVFSQRIIFQYNEGKKIYSDVKTMLKRLFLLAAIPFLLAGIFGPPLFEFVFGDQWNQSGIYMRLLLPWMFMVFLSSPLSFLPDLFKRQQKAMWIDIIKFLLRFASLFAGVMLNDIYLSIVFYSGISFLIVSFNLWWYLQLSRNY